MKRLYYIFILLFVLSCGNRQEKVISLQNTNNDSAIKAKDSLLLEKFALKIKEENDINDSNSDDYLSSKIIYSPDNKFKIFAFEIGDCGGVYCHEFYENWVYFNYLGENLVWKLDCRNIDTIIKMPNQKYLILDNGWERPQSSITEEYKSAKLLWFKNKRIYIKSVLDISQTNMVDVDDLDEFIIYNTKNQTLTYRNSSYSNDLLGVQGLDTLFTYEGVFKYKKGQFILQKEHITKRLNNIIIK